MLIRTEGWPLLALTSGALIAMVAALLVIYGLNEEAVRVLIRATARTSVVFFCAAISASALLRFFPSDSAHWLSRNRRQVGLSFGVSHVIHYAAVAALALIYPSSFFESDDQRLFDFNTSVTSFTLLAMIVTSFDGSSRLLGPRLWKGLHLFGVYLFLFAFLAAFGGLAFENIAYAPVALLLLSTLGLRLAATVARARER